MNTKLDLQIASRVLQIPATKIHISETRSDIIANGPPTGGSTGTQINGMAVRVSLRKFHVSIILRSYPATVYYDTKKLNL